MTQTATPSRFTAPLLRPARPGDDAAWTFVILPKAISQTLPRRGRTTIEGTLNGQPFSATLEPDGQQSHWLKVSEALQQAAGTHAGETVTLQIAPVATEPEPEVPVDLRDALAKAPEARQVWEATTTLARVDWIHWIVSAKQPKTRVKRIADACEMLASGKKRVCCFDPSGFYSKALQAPQAVNEA